MAFTYTEDLTVNRDFVRFHTGDTNSAESFLSDAIITSLLATSSTPQVAVISAIRYIITQLSKPNFKADWLQVDNKSAREGYEKMLAEKKSEFGLLLHQAVHKPVYRWDEDPDAIDLTTEDEDG